MDDLYYLDYSIVQNQIIQSYKSGKPVSVIEAKKSLTANQYTHIRRLNFPKKVLWSNLSDNEFELLTKQMQFSVVDLSSYPLYKPDYDEDIFAINAFSSSINVVRHFNYALERIHSNSYFECFYVFHGTGSLFFENTTLTIETGDFCILAPGSKHSLSINTDEAFILDIRIRKSTFEQNFFSQLSVNSLLSLFFRNIIYESSTPNYLLFCTGNDISVKQIIKNITMENFFEDTYNPISSTAFINVLFSFLLRNHSSHIKYFTQSKKDDFSLILQYIQTHSDSISLDEVAFFFHYSKTYLCRLIKKNTGHTFLTLVQFQQMEKAANLLKNTNYSIEKITEIIGFNSADHFSRTFKKRYQISPSEYRKKYYDNIDVPLSIPSFP